MDEFIEKALSRFIEYVKIDTQSDDTSSSIPSKMKELNLSRKLMEDLKGMGIESYLDEYGIVYGKLEGKEGLAPIGLNSHVDTALECSGKDVRPQRIRNYDGGVIRLNDQYSMSPKEFETLSAHIGDDLIVTSGDTLLGADDKAGIAIIMAVLDYYVSHPEVEHHTICFCFTPDEEIGRGPDHFDAKKFGAEYAYTIDGGIHDEIAIENFNAAHAIVRIKGVSIHPGEAKGKLVNASSVAFAFDHALPERKRPEFTSGREGFNHLVGIKGEVDYAELHYIIRNHDRKELEIQKEEFEIAKRKVEEQFPTASIDLEIGDDYRNMLEVFEKHPEAIEKAKKAFRELGITPRFTPIRGGTDGATFSFKGCPTPNLGTGSYNHHGRFEYLSVREFKTMIEIVKAIVKE
ncbi:MAG: peptidase T [Bacilli bacterium]|nr:peptidase T [Bacilli bacterium]